MSENKFDFSTATETDSQGVSRPAFAQVFDWSTAREDKPVEKYDPIQFFTGAAASGISLASMAAGGVIKATAQNVAEREKSIIDSVMQKRAQPGYDYRIDPDYADDSVALAIHSGVKKGADFFDEISNKLMDASTNIINKYIPPKEGLGNKLTYMAGGVALQVGVPFGLAKYAITAQAARAAQVGLPTLFGAAAGGDIYTRAEKSGKSVQERTAAALGVSIPTAAIESLGMSVAKMNLDKFAGKAAYAAINGISGAGQEFLQGITLEGVSKINGYTHETWMDIIKGTAVDAAIGFITGAGVAGYDIVHQQRSIVGRLRDAGASEGQIDFALNSMLDRGVKEKGDLVKKLVASGIDEATAGDIEDTVIQYGNDVQAYMGAGALVRQLQQKGFKLSDAVILTDEIMTNVSRETSQQIVDEMAKQVDDIEKAEQVLGAYEQIIGDMDTLIKPENMSDSDFESMKQSNALLMVKQIIEKADKAGMSIKDVAEQMRFAGEGENGGGVLQQGAVGTRPEDFATAEEYISKKIEDESTLTLYRAQGKNRTKQELKEGAFLASTKQSGEHYQQINKEKAQVLNEYKMHPLEVSKYGKTNEYRYSPNNPELLKRKAQLTAEWEAAKVRQVVFQQGAEEQPAQSPRAQIDLTVPTPVIKLFNGADFSSLAHELSHLWLARLWDTAKSGTAADEYMRHWKAMADFLGVQNEQTDLTVEQQEKFASAYENYLKDYSSVSGDVGRAFEAFRTWLRSVYSDAVINNVKMTPEVVKYFDEMFGVEKNDAVNVEHMAKDIDEAINEYDSVNDMEGDFNEDLKMTEKDLESVFMAEMASEKLAWIKKVNAYLHRALSSQYIKDRFHKDDRSKFLWMTGKKGRYADEILSEFAGQFPESGLTPDSSLVEFDEWLMGYAEDLRSTVSSLKDEVIAGRKVEQAYADRKSQAIKHLAKAMRKQKRLKAISDRIVASYNRGYRSGVSEGRKKAIKEQSAVRDAIVSRLRTRSEELKNIRKHIADYAITFLPSGIRGKAVTLVKNAKNWEDVTKAYIRINEWSEDNERRGIVDNIRKDLDFILESDNVHVSVKNMVANLIRNLDVEHRAKNWYDEVLAMREGISTAKDVVVTKKMAEEIAALTKQNLEKLPTAKLMTLQGKLKILRRIGRERRLTGKNEREAWKDAAMETLRGGTVAMNKREEYTPAGRSATPIETVRLMMNKIMNVKTIKGISLTPVMIVVDMLDGGADFQGANKSVFLDTLSHDFDNYLRLKDALVQPMIDKAKELKLDKHAMERVGIYAAIQQENGVEKLVHTMGENEAARWIDYQLTDNEKEWYNFVRKTFDDIRPIIDETLQEEYNKVLGKVENYWPMITDDNVLDEIEIQDRMGNLTADDIEALKKKNPNMKFTLERTGGKQKIRLNALETAFNHLDNVAYFITMSENLRKLYEIAHSDQYAEVAGDIGTSFMRNFLDTMARKGGSGSSRFRAIDIARRNVGIGTLGLKLSSMFIQPTSLLDTGREIGHYALRGAVRIMDDKWVKLVMQMQEIKHRAGDDPAYAELMNNPGAIWYGKFQEMSMTPLKKLDMWSAMATAAGAYEQYMNENGREIDFDNLDAGAMRYAQDVVARTQSSGFFKDAMQSSTRGTLTGSVSLDKMLMQFQSFVINRYSQVRYGISQDIKNRDLIAASNKVLWTLLSMFAAVGVRNAIASLYAFMFGEPDKKSKYDPLMTELLQFFPVAGGTIASWASGFPASVPIPTVSVIHQIAESGNWISAKTPEGRARGAARFFGAVGQGFGVPGSVEASTMLRKSIKIKKSGRSRRKSRSTRSTSRASNN